MDDSQLVVADAGSGDASVGAEVYYALHKARVPALCLVPRGEPVPGLPTLGESRDRLRTALRAVPWEGLKLSRGEPAIPTTFEEP